VPSAHVDVYGVEGEAMKVIWHKWPNEKPRPNQWVWVLQTIEKTYRIRWGSMTSEGKIVTESGGDLGDPAAWAIMEMPKVPQGFRKWLKESVP
jgi:hypothetical protein